MLRVCSSNRFTLLIALYLSLLCGKISSSEAPPATCIQVNDDNWSQILIGEWMVEFYAPWCPACRSLQPVWEQFSTWSNDLDIKVGQVDITNSPGLSGRFMITALPTIYHVREGTFRQYRGPRSKEDFLSFIEEKKWQDVEPISSWQSPESLQMSLISQFYRISMTLRNVMNVMFEDYGIPTWAAYLIFGLATIVVGLILGLVLVCIIDFIYPPGGSVRKPEEAGDRQDIPTERDDRLDDPIADADDTEEAENDDEQLDEDSEEEIGDEEPSKDQEVDKQPDNPSSEARRRKVRKAD